MARASIQRDGRAGPAVPDVHDGPPINVALLMQLRESAWRHPHAG